MRFEFMLTPWQDVILDPTNLYFCCPCSDAGTKYVGAYAGIVAFGEKVENNFNF